ncbi:MAG: DUF4340 domain-containing protein [Bacteroidota bacterium]
MTNATKTLSIIFVVLAAVTGLYSWMGKSGSSEGLRAELVTVEPENVNRILIENEGRGYPITLQKEDEQWMVQSREGTTSYPANQQAVESALDELTALNIKALVTRDAQKHARYQVDSTGTDVKLFNGDSQLAHVILGKPQIISRSQFNTYMRLSDENDVYSVEGFLSASFNKDIPNWRDKQIWDLNAQDVQRVDFLFPADSSYSVERAGSDSWISGGDTLNTRSVDNMVSRLTDLRANGFIDDSTPEKFGQEIYAIQVQLSNGMQRTVRVQPDPENDNQYRAVANQYPYVFTVSKSSWDNTVLVGRQSLLEN